MMRTKVKYIFVIIGIEIKYACTLFGYWIRPYDMLADARRWIFIPRICCKCGSRAWWFTHSKVKV